MYSKKLEIFVIISYSIQLLNGAIIFIFMKTRKKYMILLVAQNIISKSIIGSKVYCKLVLASVNIF